MVPEVILSKIIPIPWSDHNAVYTSVASTIPKGHDPSWYLPDVLLKHPSHCLTIQQALNDYVEHNTSDEISSLTIWEAHKPVLRGILQQQAGILKQDRVKLARQLETEFNASFVAFQNNPNQKGKIRLEKARLEYNLFLTESADKSLRKTKHMFYKNSNKPSTLMARALKSINKSYKPIRLKIADNVYTSNPLKIVQKFSSHLKTLYTETNKTNIEEADAFFSRINLPKMTESQKLSIEKPITSDEVAEAIKTLKINKRPGPDGFTALYYRTFTDIISPMLVEAFNDLLNNKSFRQESLLAIICMIPKPHSDDSLCTNYRPISMLNMDIKVLAKILAA